MAQTPPFKGLPLHALALRESTMKITHIDVHPISAPVRPGAIHSVEYHDTTDPRAWIGIYFDKQHKFIYEVHTDEKTVGVGESYRGTDERLVRDKVLVDFWCGRQSPKDLRTRMKQAVRLGYHGIKMKYCWGDPHRERAEVIEEVGGKDFAIIFDPNMRCHNVANTVTMARDLDGFNVTCFEDPIPRWDLDGFRLLRQKIQIPIAFHTHLPYEQTVYEMLSCVKKDAADFYNLSGSVAGVLHMAGIADAAGCPVWHGSEVDLGILEAAYLHTCAAMRNCTLPSDLFGELIRVDDCIAQPHNFLRGKDGVYLQVPQGVGLGVELDRRSLKRFAI